MRRIRIATIAVFMAWALASAMREAGTTTDSGMVSAANAAAPVAQTPAATPPATSTPPPPMPMQTSAYVDTFAAERDSMMNAVLKEIAGHESTAAESVFKNIKLLKGMPAGRVLRIMNMGWGKGLGVRCAHCHDTKKWDSDDKPQKQITRDMSAMTQTINNEMLPKIKNLRSEKPGVNCTTCHRGSIKPAQNL